MVNQKTLKTQAMIKASETVILHIKNLLECGRLLPGDKIPSERKLSGELGVSRMHVRDAIRKLEFYGILKTVPQSGTYVAEQAVWSLESMISDVVRIGAVEFKDLVHIRTLLEIDAARLCAVNRTEEDLAAIRLALCDYEANYTKPLRVDKDLALHRSIALGSHNSALASLLLVIAPDVLANYHKHKVCAVPESVVLEEHKQIVEAIGKGDPDLVENRLRTHFKTITELAESI